MRFAADENFDGNVYRQLRKRLPDLDIVRVQDTSMYQSQDPILLEWAAEENRIILTHDVRTLVGYAYERIKNGLFMPGVILVSDFTDVGKAVSQLEMLIATGYPDDFLNQVIFVPLPI